MVTNTQIRISNGRYVDLASFKPEDVDLESINKSLNQIKRFTGHFQKEEPLTVAAHTGLCMKLADVLYPNDIATFLMCLIHDFPEAYYSDFSSPLKRFLGDNLATLKNIDKTLYGALWLFDNEEMPQAIDRMKFIDHISLRAEQTAMWGGYDYDKDDELERDVLNVLNLYPVEEWRKYVSERYFSLQNTYLVIANKHRDGQYAKRLLAA